MATDQPQPLAGPMEEVLARLGEHTDQLDLLGRAVAEHEDLLQAFAGDGSQASKGGKGYSPIPTPRWHDLEGTARAAAIGRLRDWVARVYVPVYGHLAAGLGPCWPEHPLALVVLDHISETWAMLYTQTARTQRVLSAQLEFQLRYLPAAAEMLRTETHGCGHARPGTAS